MNAKDRLLEFLKFNNIGQTKFEESVEISRGYINNNKGSDIKMTMIYLRSLGLVVNEDVRVW